MDPQTWSGVDTMPRRTEAPLRSAGYPGRLLSLTSSSVTGSERAFLRKGHCTPTQELKPTSGAVLKRKIKVPVVFRTHLTGLRDSVACSGRDNELKIIVLTS